MCCGSHQEARQRHLRQRPHTRILMSRHEPAHCTRHTKWQQGSSMPVSLAPANTVTVTSHTVNLSCRADCQNKTPPAQHKAMVE